MSAIADGLRAELEEQRRARILPVALEEMVRRSPMIPEPSMQRATLRWLQGQMPEERVTFAAMLEGVERRAAADAEAEAWVDRILAEEAR